MSADTDQWQPIETAPKDGTEILVYEPLFGCKIVSWVTSVVPEESAWMIDLIEDVDPTHWRPLPAPPPREEKEG